MYIGFVFLFEIVFVFMVGFGIGFYDGFFGFGIGLIFIVCFVVLGYFSLVEVIVCIKVFNFMFNIVVLIFFLIVGLLIWEIGLIMVVGGFIGVCMGVKVVISKG